MEKLNGRDIKDIVEMDFPLVTCIENKERRARHFIIAGYVINTCLGFSFVFLHETWWALVTVFIVFAVALSALKIEFEFKKFAYLNEPVYLLILMYKRKDKHFKDHLERFNSIASGRYICTRCNQRIDSSVAFCFHMHDEHDNKK